MDQTINLHVYGEMAKSMLKDVPVDNEVVELKDAIYNMAICKIRRSTNTVKK
jgi:hypothetical protein